MASGLADFSQITEEQKELLGDYLVAMPLAKVDRLMGWRTGTARGAVERGEMRYIQLPGSPRIKVTPAFIAEWVRDYCTHQKPLFAGYGIGEV